MLINSSFWYGKKVLITGHTGFKGSWLSLWLQELGANVVGISLDPPSNPSLYEQANVADGIVDIREDIRNLDKIKKLFKEHQPEIVFHLAAQPLVRYSYREPVETYAINVMGTLHILEAIKAIKTVRSVIMITTDKCYENKEWEWGYRENEPMGGHDPYSSSKGCAELLIASYRDSYFPVHDYAIHQTAIASVRAGNVIGGGDWAEDRLIPDILRAFEKNKTVIVRNPRATRPWQHVLEPLSGYLVLAERMYSTSDGYSEGWNFGPLDNDVKPVEWILEYMISKWDGANWQLDNNAQPHEAGFLKLDISKAKSRLNWQPTWKLEDSLDRIICWHQDWLNKKNMRTACLNNIKDYIREMNNAHT